MIPEVVGMYHQRCPIPPALFFWQNLGYKPTGWQAIKIWRCHG
jgi:hypothetical protein